MADGTTIATLRNVSRFLALVDRLQNRRPGAPGLGVFYGFPGLGKSMAASYCANATNAIHVQMKSVWAAKRLCEAIMEELGLQMAARLTVADMVDRIAEAVLAEDVTILIDEADFLVKNKLIEVVRDIYESSDTPMILIGEELMPQKLRRWEKVHSRVLSFVAAEYADDQDFELLKELRCPDVEIDPELEVKCKAASNGSARRIVVNLDAIHELSRVIGTGRVTLADWVGRDFYKGDTPLARGAQR
ncbi:AAA family ATPase [Palleronia caenipelagi]|uniref:ATP-binding protein n=1 Tax=Palleronia caenipelagi TaxID=2489174 RepID=A0A547PW38_9RHOB|nr:ATP-binding protein [Palleronia caenipelagi]TRD18369.1 ATP-binding protein [Palleronia caenipelagi]